MIILFHLIVFISKYLVTTLSKCLSNKFDVTEAESQCSENGESSIVFHQESVATECVYLNGQLKFFPPVYLQRYEAVFSVLQQSPWRENTRKVVDFGCSELGFFLYMKHLSNIEEILEVDIDEDALKSGVSRAAPLNSDYLFCKRETPLKVCVLAGSIAEYDNYLLGTDAVVAIEVIEHLYPDVLDKLPENIFHNIRPKIAVFTTPNADFNELFPNNDNINGFRHPDHKFEWSRKEFYNWSQKILESYPNYSVKFYGVGAGPEGSENLGCCTQMAVFTKTDGFKDETCILDAKCANSYKLIRQYEYPFFIDYRSDEEKILDEVLYRLKFTVSQDNYYNYEDCSTEFPLSEFMEYICSWCDSLEKLKKILVDHGFHVKERDGYDVLVYCGQLEASYGKDEESSGEYTIPEYIPKSNLPTENWELDWDDGNFNATLMKVVEEDLLTSPPDRSLEETENSKAESGLSEIEHEGIIGDRKTDFDTLPDKPPSYIPSECGRQSSSAECFDNSETLKKKKKKKKYRNTLLRKPSKNLVRTLSLPMELKRNP